jgi:hypothetical protein
MQSEPNSTSPKESTVLSTQSLQSSTQHGKHHISVHRSSDSSYGVPPEPSHITADGDIIGGSLSDDNGTYNPDLIPRTTVQPGALNSVAVDLLVSDVTNVLESALDDTRNKSRSSKKGLHITDLPNGAQFSIRLYTCIDI